MARDRGNPYAYFGDGENVDVLGNMRRRLIRESPSRNRVQGQRYSAADPAFAHLWQGLVDVPYGWLSAHPELGGARSTELRRPVYHRQPYTSSCIYTEFHALLVQKATTQHTMLTNAFVGQIRRGICTCIGNA